MKECVFCIYIYNDVIELYFLPKVDTMLPYRAHRAEEQSLIALILYYFTSQRTRV